LRTRVFFIFKFVCMGSFTKHGAWRLRGRRDFG